MSHVSGAHAGPTDVSAVGAGRRVAGAVLAAFATLAVHGSAWADESEEDAGVSAWERARAEATAKAPSGPWKVFAERRAVGAARVCSARLPVCVHADARGAAMLDALAALERGWDLLTGALRLPAPDVSVERATYDVVLEPGVPGGWDTRLVERDARSAYDRGLAESSLDAAWRPGCALDAAAFRALARASLFRVVPATTEGVARAQVAYLTSLAVPCSLALAAPEVRAFQAEAARGVVDARAGAPGAAEDPWTEGRYAGDPSSRLFADGAALFWARLDWAFGNNPGDIVHASWTLAPTRTKPDAARWWNEPDAFDVLRVSFKNALSTGSTLADALLDVAVARAFVGDADDGAHQPELRTLGEAAHLTPEWDVPWPGKPRRFAPRAPVSPTGSSYLVVRTAGAKPGARLRVEIEWEEHALFRWAAIKVDASGRALSRFVIPTRDRAVEAQATILDLEGTDRVLLVGVNVGDPAYPFDPDDEVWEPHGWLVSIAEE